MQKNIVFAIVSCGPAQERPVVATALDELEVRHLHVLDERPQYVDESVPRCASMMRARIA